MSITVSITEPVPVPAELLDPLRKMASERGLWLHNAVEEALRLWLRSERRRKRRQVRRLARHEQLTGDDIRTLVRLHLTRSEARQITKFTEWLRTADKREIDFWSGSLDRERRAS